MHHLFSLFRFLLYTMKAAEHYINTLARSYASAATTGTAVMNAIVTIITITTTTGITGWRPE